MLKKIIKKIGEFNISQNVYLAFCVAALFLCLVAIIVGCCLGDFWLLMWPGMCGFFIFTPMTIVGVEIKMRKRKRKKDE